MEPIVHQFCALSRASIAQALVERTDSGCVWAGRSGVKETDHRHRRLLGARGERPCCRRSAKQSDEVAPFQLNEFSRFNISGSLAMFDATRLASSIGICFASMASASVERP
jgi:hypothetical protein